MKSNPYSWFQSLKKTIEYNVFFIQNYFKYFGWLYLFLVVILVIVQCFFYETFPFILIVTVFSIFLWEPLKLVYMLIGSKNSLTAFMILFIITQLLFAWAYSVYLYPKHSFSEILLNTFSTSLTQQPMNIFEDFMLDKNWDSYKRIFYLLNAQIFISWIYLGVLIAGLYQKLRNE